MAAATVPEQTLHQYHRWTRGAHDESMASTSSSVFRFRQTPSESVTGYYHVPERHEIRIDIPSQDNKILGELVKEKNSDGLAMLGGVEGIGNSLKTDMDRGIKGSNEDISLRIESFGANTCVVLPRAKSFIHFVWEASFKDPALLILLICSALSLGFGIKAEQVWYDGVALLFAVLVVISVSAITNFRQDRLFDKQSRNIPAVQVVRDGRRQHISISEIVVGDVVFLMIGDHVPADGLFIEGHSLVVQPTAGESDSIEVNRHRNPFLFSGTMVVDGYAKMLVTAVGKNTNLADSTMTLESDEKTPLQARLNKLSSVICKVGIAVALLVLVVLLVRYFFVGVGKTKDENGNNKDFFFINGSSMTTYKHKVVVVINSWVRISAAVVAVAALPKGLALGFTAAIAYSMKRMNADRALIRKVSTLESMGLLTTICTDEIGITNLKVSKAFIGTESMQGKSYTWIEAKVRQLFLQGIILSRDSVHKLSADTKIDDAVHLWAFTNQNMQTETSQDDLLTLDVEAENKRIGVLVKGKSDKKFHAHWRGDAERIISSSSHYFNSTGTSKALDEQERGKLKQIMENMAASGLICTAFAYKELTEEEFENQTTENQKIPDEGLILLVYVGLKVHHRPDTKEAVESCQRAEINVTMVTSENSSVATAFAEECGILSSNYQEESVVEGEEFRNYTENERMERVENIRVMARSSPQDKRLLVQCLQKRGHVVAVTGDGKNDVPAMKVADVSLSMGIQSTQVAKENSDIVILDDTFSSIVTVLRWGRSIHVNIKKLIQFQLTVNVAALAITFVAAVSSGEVALTAVQLLWVNLIMNTLGALALATEKPSKILMSTASQTNPLITNVMWRNIISLALYQIAVILFFKFKGESIIFGAHENVIKSTFTFTSFVLLQVFNLLNARKLEEKNVFEGILSNKVFFGIIGMIIILHVVMVEFLNKFVIVERLNWKEWGVCVGIAVFSLPMSCLVKFIPVPNRPLQSSKQLILRVSNPSSN